MRTLSLLPIRLLAVIMLAIALVLAALPFASRASASSSPLFISEYVSGSGDNKALEIYNPGPLINLAAAPHVIEIYFDGAASAGAEIPLHSGFIEEGGVWVIAHPAADQAVLDAADQTHTGLAFDGNDLIVLVRDAVVDRIGQYGVDPGTAWGEGDTSTADNTLRRLESATGGDPNFMASFDPSVEWVGVGLDVSDGLGCWGESACIVNDPPIDGTPFDALLDAVETYRDDGSLSESAADALVKHLDRAEQLVTQDDGQGAKGQLRAFVARLRGLAVRGEASPQAAASLTAAAQELIDSP